jgi:hypothetical protein
VPPGGPPVLLAPARQPGLVRDEAEQVRRFVAAVSRRADVDNENDEYHVAVSVLDVWAEYHRLADKENGEGWTFQKIADAKGVSKTDVHRRVTWHTDLCPSARKACSDGIFDEGHLDAFYAVVPMSELSGWLTKEQTQEELVAEVLGKHRGKTSDDPAIKKPTVAAVRKAAGSCTYTCGRRKRPGRVRPTPAPA